MLFCEAHKNMTVNPVFCFFCRELDLLQKIAKSEEARATAEYLYHEALRDIERLKK